MKVLTITQEINTQQVNEHKNKEMILKNTVIMEKNIRSSEIKTLRGLKIMLCSYEGVYI